MPINRVTLYINILPISETKLDNTFPHVLYHLKYFSNTYRLDRYFRIAWNFGLHATQYSI